jgi:hypothetical protein
MFLKKFHAQVKTLSTNKNERLHFRIGFLIEDQPPGGKRIFHSAGFISYVQNLPVDFDNI